MHDLTLKEAAEQVGRSKQAIRKAIKDGRLSGYKDINGIYKIQAAELFRKYQPVQSSNCKDDITNDSTNDNTPVKDSIIDKYERDIEYLKAQLEAAEERAKAADTERKETQEKMTLLLEDFNKKPSQDHIAQQLAQAEKERKEAQDKVNQLLEEKSKKKGLLGRIFG